MAIQAMDDVRREALRSEPEEVPQALQGAHPKTRRHLLWGDAQEPAGWTAAQTGGMYWLQRSTLKSPRLQRLRMALREVYARAWQHNSAEQAASDPAAHVWLTTRAGPSCAASVSHHAELDAIAGSLNTHPRATHNWHAPLEAFALAPANAQNPAPSVH